jgi:hypothetical protein
VTWVWIGVFIGACLVPMVAWVWLVEHRDGRDSGEESG